MLALADPASLRVRIDSRNRIARLMRSIRGRRVGSTQLAIGQGRMIAAGFEHQCPLERTEHPYSHDRLSLSLWSGWVHCNASSDLQPGCEFSLPASVDFLLERESMSVRIGWTIIRTSYADLCGGAMYKNILVPVDGSEASRLALAEAIEFAKTSGGRLQLMHVLDEFVIVPAVDAAYMGSAYADSVAALGEYGRQILDDAEAMVKQAGVEVQSAFVETMGHRVAELIIEKARQWPAHLIVMGTHGRRGLRRLVLGSDAEGVLRSTPVPVLMVRGPETAR